MAAGCRSLCEAKIASRHRVSVVTAVRICLHDPPTPLSRDVHHPVDLTFCVPPLAHNAG